MAGETRKRQEFAADRPNLVKPRLPRGFQDRGPAEIKALEAMLGAIREVYELYGFEPVETPLIEYTDALGKFLPDQDRPNEGVFSFEDDGDWLSLRYDLTAPLARYFAENFETLPKPYRSYRVGPVFRNEKPGPGRFRQFLQFDADTVGAATVAADAEMCMMAADCLERLGVSRGDYAIRVNNRKVLDGLLDAIGLAGEAHAGRRLTVLRAMDKLDRLGLDGVRALLGRGRMDESGDYAKGAEIEPDDIDRVLAFLAPGGNPLERMEEAVGDSEAGREGVAELREIEALCAAAGYQDRVRIDPSVVRGLEYYTGPVFEAELTFTIANEDGQLVRFGSVGGGGRYDGLVARFRGDPVPATGFSIGVSRLQAALAALGRLGAEKEPGPVVVLVMDRERIAEYQELVTRLRGAGIRAELYLGSSGMKAQMKYADRRNSPCVVIQGSNEREQGVVQIKDLIEGARLAGEVADRAVWREARPAQFTVPVTGFVEAVAEVLARHRTP